MSRIDTNQVKHVSVVRKGHDWMIVPRLKPGGEAIDSLRFDHKTSKLLVRKFDYSDEAHDAAQQVFRHATVDVVGSVVRSTFSRSVRREIASVLWESGNRDLAVQFAKATLPRR